MTVPTDATRRTSGQAARMYRLGRGLFDRGLTGNLSVRLDDDTVLITPSGRSMEDMHPDTLARITMKGEHPDGPPPSKEAFLHLALLRARPTDKAVARATAPTPPPCPALPTSTTTTPCRHSPRTSPCELGSYAASPTNAGEGPSRCPCRKRHPLRSCGISVLVENAAEVIGSSDVEAGCLVRIGDRRRQGVQRAGVRDALVGPVGVVELFELAQGMEQVPLVPDQGAVQQLAPTGLHPPLHDRSFSASGLPSARPRSPRRPGRRRTERGLAVPVPDQEPCPAAGVLEVHDEVLRRCATQAAVGCAVAPTTRIRRVACSITAKTYSHVPVSVTVSKKSVPARPELCDRSR